MMSSDRQWPTDAMLDFSRRFVPWAEERIAEEISAGYPALRGIPGSTAEASLEIFNQLGPDLAKKYMVLSLHRSAAWREPPPQDHREAEFLERIATRLAQASSRLWEKPRRGFDQRRFIEQLPRTLSAAGHTAYHRSRNVVSARWTLGLIEVETELILGKKIAYLHRVKLDGELMCLQMSVACWLSVDAATTYEPGREHSPEQVLAHMLRYWKVFLDAVPLFVGYPPGQAASEAPDAS